MNVNFKHLCIICFFLPLLTIIISFIWSANLNLINWCIPNFDGCTSISRVGRYEPVVYFFKPLMLIYAIFLGLFWKNYYELLNFDNINISKFSLLIAYCSILFLVLYIIFLGEGKLYKFFRQIGIFIYIFFTVLTQIIFSNKLKSLSYFNKKIGYLIYYYSLILGLVGLLLFPFMIMKIIEITNFKNIVSWNYFLLIQIYFLMIFFGLKKKL
tara:strand:+ start:73 stop:708 length:636 start_codon:yes stop_codon:yes gene_type:complete